jgi:hypothetical protein
MEERMNKPFRLILVSIATVIPSVASGQTTTAFDSTYQGVSNTASAGGGPNCGSFAPVPRPLTISNGVARFEGGLKGTAIFQGNVSPQGYFTMRDNLANRIDGKVDPSGKATASITLGGANCTLSAVWQKQQKQ